MKKLLFDSLLAYRRWMPVERGKARLANLVSRVTGPVPYRLPEGLWMVLYPDSAMDLSYLHAGEGSPHHEITRLIDEVPAGGTVVDVGANAGYISLLAARRVGQRGKVWAFEPSPREYERLREAIRLNGYTQITAVPAALSDREGQMQLNVAEAHTGVNKLATDQQPRSAQQATVAVKVLDKELRDSGPIDLVKIDVEGAEMRVLAGMTRLLDQQLVRRLVLEVTPDFLAQFGDTRAAMYKLLADAGYHPVWPEPDAWQYDQLFEPRS